MMIFFNAGGQCVNWEEWWTYDGISGPQFWGVINPDWRLCNEGRRQSPIDIDTKRYGIPWRSKRQFTKKCFWSATHFWQWDINRQEMLSFSAGENEEWRKRRRRMRTRRRTREALKANYEIQITDGPSFFSGHVSERDKWIEEVLIFWQPSGNCEEWTSVRMLGVYFIAAK